MRRLRLDWRPGSPGPTVGKTTIYAAADGSLKQVAEDGTESDLGGASPGGSQPVGYLLYAGDQLRFLDAGGDLADPAFVAFRPGTREAWVLYQGGFAVLDEDGAVVATVAKNWDQPAFAFTPDGLKAYVSDFDGNCVWIIDAVARTVGASIACDDNPYAVAVTPDGTKAYVCNQNAGTVTPIDVATDTAGAPIDVGAGTLAGGGSGPACVVFKADGTKAYVMGAATGVVVPITVANDTPGAPLTPPHFPQPYPQCAALLDGIIYITADEGDLMALDTSDDSFENFSFSGTPGTAVAADPTSGLVYALSDFLYAIDPATQTKHFTPVGDTAISVAVSDDGTRGWVANNGGYSLSRIGRIAFVSLATG